ncbi:hypothetical protein Q765_03255 [Flavobacterium rivuli WB 3.3-2 = DSM 21788]|uniref:Uncharacterized protein n=1 Tax=Flavobacterium rivuli WB 3.3-2 = DSM 21788 TaxID=1121895 RepID=A0A0A2MID7_9FLAO|nr:hypothetical protein [Flavobacterium rivuli]KGO88085.1 hypothetical protein Q765_03255 [Flavobacterium rivuli WB 3.3-2 = DSM 21788]
MSLINAVFNGPDMETGKLLFEEFTKLKEDLVKKYDELGMRASGNFESSLEIEITKNKAVLSTTARYAEQLEYGRGPNSGQSGQKWDDPIGDIEQWLIDKGVAATVKGYIRDKSVSNKVEKEITRSALAYLIVRKIFKEGWKRENFGGVHLMSQVITPERIQSIIDKLSDIYVTGFTSALVDYIKKEL